MKKEKRPATVSTGKITATILIPLAAYSEVVAQLEQLEQINGVVLEETNLTPLRADDELDVLGATTNTNETNRELPGDEGKAELATVDPQFAAAQRALEELLRALAVMKGWRASMVYEAANNAYDVLLQESAVAWELLSMPEDYELWPDRHWAKN